MADTHPLAPTDAEIIALLRPLYASDEAASMGAADDLRTARAILAKWGAQPVVPAGYALVPVEPTPEMLSEIWVHKNGSLSEAYRAMLAAAPQPVAREPLTDEQIESAAKVLAASSWDHMPEKGRETMRGHVRAVIAAATAKP